MASSTIARNSSLREEYVTGSKLRGPFGPEVEWLYGQPLIISRAFSFADNCDVPAS